jgi:hypothetical protein
MQFDAEINFIKLFHPFADFFFFANIIRAIYIVREPSGGNDDVIITKKTRRGNQKTGS